MTAELQRAVRTAGVLSAIAYSGAVLLMPAAVQARLHAAGERVTAVIVHAATAAWDTPDHQERTA